MNIWELESEYLMHTYKKNICLERGDGCRVYDDKGNMYLDMIGGIATCSVGHNNPEIVETIAAQAGKIINASNLFYTKPQVMLSKKLSELSDLGHCFFSNSGSEAVEAAIKLARKNTKKHKIIAMTEAFHGRTLGALSATWNNKYKEPFGQMVPGFEHVVYGNIESLKKMLDDDTAAVMVEPIQGEAGVVVPPEDYLKSVEELCKEHGTLLILDEIQTGNGRTGRYFCYQNHGISPDIVTLAKGLANGVPIGVTISKNEIDFEPGDHGTTFGGNSLSCMTALKTIEIIESLMPEVSEKGDYFMSKLKEISSDKIVEVRGKGLMIAVELNKKGADYVDKCAGKGLLINCAGENNLRFLPPLTVTKEEIDEAVGIIEYVLTYGD